MKTFWDKIAPLSDFSESLNKKVYDKNFEVFKKLYSSNKKNFQLLNGQ